MIGFGDLLRLKREEFGPLCLGIDPSETELNNWGLPDTANGAKDFGLRCIDAAEGRLGLIKPQVAFFERFGSSGYAALEEVLQAARDQDLLVIADAKRGDIGNTSSMYAKAFFEDLAFDAVTVAPYMGKDSVEPFLAFEQKHTIMLALTSNQGAFDFQTKISEGEQLYKQVLKTSTTWQNAHNLMYVIGATKATYLAQVRAIVPDSFLLVPGVGAQGGNLQDVCTYGMNANIGLLVNSSRGIIYASSGSDFAEAATKAAHNLQQQMQVILDAM